MGGREHNEGAQPPRALHDGPPVLAGAVRWMQEGVVLHDAEGRIVEATPAACELLGVPERDLLGVAPADVFGEDPTRAGWRMVDLDGRLFPADRNPSVVTARTGESATEVMGVVRPDGSRSGSRCRRSRCPSRATSDPW